MNTHYERTLCARAGPVDDLAATCVALARQGRELAIVDALRAYAAPDVHGPFREFVDSGRGKEILHFLATLLAATGLETRGQVTTQLLLAWQLVRFEQAGKRVYVASPALQRQLLATELRGLRCRDLRLPYACVYVEVEPSLAFASSMTRRVGTVSTVCI